MWRYILLQVMVIPDLVPRQTLLHCWSFYLLRQLLYYLMVSNAEWLWYHCPGMLKEEWEILNDERYKKAMHGLELYILLDFRSKLFEIWFDVDLVLQSVNYTLFLPKYTFTLSVPLMQHYRFSHLIRLEKTMISSIRERLVQNLLDYSIST